MSEYDDLIDSGKKFYDKNEWDKAIAEYTKAIEIEQNEILAYFNRGTIYQYKRDYDSAILDFTKIINIKPENAFAYKIRGDVYKAKRDYDFAIADYTKAIELEPNNLKTYIDRGDSYRAKRDYDSTIADYSEAIEKKYNKPRLLKERGDVYYCKGEYEKAVNDFTEVIETNPEDLSCYSNRGDAYLQYGKYDNAFNDFNKLREIYLKRGLDRNAWIVGNHFINRIFKLDDNFFWQLNHPVLKYLSYHPFIKLINKFIENNFDSPKYRKLITSVFILWTSRQYKYDETKIYQYTSQATLNKMQESHRLRLTPAAYTNDPEEGFVFYKCLKEMLNENDEQIKEIIDKIKTDTNTNSIAFIRSFTDTDNEDNLVMWDSSYAENAKGVSIGISSYKLNKGFGLPDLKGIIESDETGKQSKSEPPKNISDDEKNLQIEKTGLYKILYLDKSKNHNEEMKEIENALLPILQEYLHDNDENRKSNLILLLAELFTPVAHLIKDSSYAHEKEYRLMYIGSIKDDEKYIDGDMNTGIYIETEPILFENQNDKEVIYFGPKVDNITVLKAKHTFAYEGLAANIDKSKIQYR
jgi:tetratricopeptide (TPR) repeat protein